MNCTSPRELITYEKKSPHTAEKHYKLVPCGKCFNCKMKRKSDMTIRLMEEWKHSDNAYFITLTYDDKFVPLNDDGIQVVNKPDVQNFLKRLRFNLYGKTKGTLKYFLVAEYGPRTLRPHYHALMYNLPLDNADDVKEELYRAWRRKYKGEKLPIGWVTVTPVNEKRVKYCTAYTMENSKKKDDALRCWTLSSKHLGMAYIDKMKDWHKDDIMRNYYPKENGEKTRLPRYYRDKIYTKMERETQNIAYMDMAEIEKEKITFLEEAEQFRDSVKLSEIREAKRKRNFNKSKERQL